MLAQEIWDKLSAIDVTKHTEKKGKFTYLSWAWAWAEFSKLYPNCEYKLSDRTFDDKTMEVYCKMKVYGDGHLMGVKRNMWLPVLNHQNKPITNPNAFDVNNAKMRCLVKCLAMYGLGHYLYAGEDLPQQPTLQDHVRQNEDSINAIKTGIADKDLSAAAEEWFTLSDEVKASIWKAPTKSPDAPFTTVERDMIRSTEFRVAYFGEPEPK